MGSDIFIFDIEIGDRIKFTIETRNGKKTATRVVNGFWGGSSKIPTVEFEGWKDFAVNHIEIKAVFKK